ncbi:hypothetical protein CNEO4_240010 [Clostridium neonatale]|uniref:Uncharacterized protein n=1 Tax=Clostridium neonatale TaxID=137838 RepID=A0AA86MPM2_9CLOT|nr:hypothetical protein CNEO_43451 [Clostridium neonatale]CAG9715105.1 hypothetical protein CNEO_280036 [Clostridium neonatale]CAI3539404.1 hypothetical protein CNEO3_180070 [Clostridium neonatale]CAI3569632.1 hypothetical protein CNEO4_170011 [Clostridium neonatale]CAI3580979.1 hypothetical protein CNEO3_170023 [Clostridium neonatale]
MLPEERIGADGIQISMIALKELLKKEEVTFKCERILLMILMLLEIAV